MGESPRNFYCGPQIASLTNLGALLFALFYVLWQSESGNRGFYVLFFAFDCFFFRRIDRSFDCVSTRTCRVAFLWADLIVEVMKSTIFFTFVLSGKKNGNESKKLKKLNGYSFVFSFRWSFHVD